MSLCKTWGRWKNFDCVFEFSVKSYVRNTINLSCAKILFPSVIYIKRPTNLINFACSSLTVLQTNKFIKY
jgi:hypothetical protein